MTEEKFKVGDVVRMRSGGPSMTVLEVIHQKFDTILFTCGYFDKNDRFRKAYVTPECIVKN